MPPRSRHQPRKKPTQRRSRETVRALVEAAARVLATEGLEGFTTNRVAEVAGVGVGSLYQYFPAKEALIGAVIEARLEQDLAQTRALLHDETRPLSDRLVAVVELLCERQHEGASLMAALLAMLGAVERAALADRMFDGLSAELHARLLAEPQALRPALRDPEALEIALFVVGRSLRWTTNAAVTQRPQWLGDPRFRAELRRLVLGLLDEGRAPT